MLFVHLDQVHLCKWACVFVRIHVSHNKHLQRVCCQATPVLVCVFVFVQDHITCALNHTDTPAFQSQLIYVRRYLRITSLLNQNSPPVSPVKTTVTPCWSRTKDLRIYSVPCISLCCLEAVTWWQVRMSAVHTKKPDTACAAGVMRKIGWSGLSSGASGSHEILGPIGAAVGGGPGAATRGESSPSLSERGTSRLHSLNIWKWHKVWVTVWHSP